MGRSEQIYDVVVVGGGIAGVCAAMSSARCGVKVALVHDRPLLGGNASGELKIHIAGADCSGNAIARFVRESGIIDEIRIENLHRNPANSQDILSVILREFIWAEPNITLFMNTHVRDVRMSASDKIESIEADQLTTEKTFVFKAKIFIDCTGDGFISDRAGAKFRIGREAKDEFNESLAPKQADSKTLPSCVEFYLQDMGKPTPFHPPSWAYKYKSDKELPFRDISRQSWQFGDFCGGFWWLSAGGDKSTIDDNEEIYEELLRVLMGIFDLMKNGGDYGADNFAIDWISPIPGKRESRRCQGDYWLTQNDVLEGKIFPDAVAYGGWPIDIHPPEGVFSKEPPNLAIPLARPYTIPLRCLYSVNIDNLMFAGRNASYTHIGLGSSRVMATCGFVGQAAGVAGALAVFKNKTPREIRESHIAEVQQTLMRQGVYIPYCKNDDKSDLAQIAKVSASSESPLNIRENEKEKIKFEYPLFQLFPVSDGKLKNVEIFIDAKRNSKFKASLRYAKDIWDFSSVDNITVADAIAQEDGKQWLTFGFDAKNLSRGFYWINVESPDSDASWFISDEVIPGLVCGIGKPPESRIPELAPKYKTMRGTFIFRLSPTSYPFPPDNVINGVARCEQWTNFWRSKPIEKSSPEWLQLSWSTPQRIGEIHFAFDGQFDSNIIWPAPLGVFGCETLPTIVKQYEIQIKQEGQWKTIICETDNYKPMHIHKFETIETDNMRILIHKTNGVKEARIFEIRVY